MIPAPLNRFRYILASKSPRRQQLLHGMGFRFRIEVREIEESVPDGLAGAAIALHLAEAKAAAFSAGELEPDTILITADTIVWLDGKMLGKPTDKPRASAMLRQLSGRMHEVFTGVCLKSANGSTTFVDKTEVYFRELDQAQIDFYVQHFSPLDKAGAYGVQEWIGYVGVDRICGSFYNVMGLPTQMFYGELEQFIQKEIMYH